MRIALFPSSVGPRICVVHEGEVCDIAAIYASYLSMDGGVDEKTARAASNAAMPQDFGALLADDQKFLDHIRRVVDFVASCSIEKKEALRERQALVAFSDQKMLPPLGAHARIFAVGLNYGAHVAEVGATPREFPPFHLRTHESLVGHQQNIVRPKLSEQLDWEIEMTAVIGKPGRHIGRETAMSHIAGYTIMNEGSVRDYISKERGNMPGNNFDGSGSLGPWMTTADEIADPHNLDIRTTVNGAVMQEANTSDLIFDLPALIGLISEFTKLQPGDLIATGSPSGVALHRHPSPWLKSGDIASFSVSGIGELVNPLINE